MVKELYKRLKKQPWYPKAKEHFISAWHTFAAAFILAAVVQYNQTDINNIPLTVDAIAALFLAAARVCVKAGLQALGGLITAWAKK